MSATTAPIAGTATSGPTYARRAARPDDEVFLRDLFAAGLPPVLREPTLLALQYAGRERSYAAAYPEARDEIAEIDGEPVGRVLTADLGDRLVVVDIAVTPARRGAGLGTALLRDVLDEASSRGIPVELAVDPDNPARRLYGRLGFRPVASTATHLTLSARPQEELR